MKLHYATILMTLSLLILPATSQAAEPKKCDRIQQEINSINAEMRSAKYTSRDGEAKRERIRRLKDQLAKCRSRTD